MRLLFVSLDLWHDWLLILMSVPRLGTCCFRDDQPNHCAISSMPFRLADRMDWQIDKILQNWRQSGCRIRFCTIRSKWTVVVRRPSWMRLLRFCHHLTFKINHLPKTGHWRVSSPSCPSFFNKYGHREMARAQPCNWCSLTSTNSGSTWLGNTSSYMCHFFQLSHGCVCLWKLILFWQLTAASSPTTNKSVLSPLPSSFDCLPFGHCRIAASSSPRGPMTVPPLTTTIHGPVSTWPTLCKTMSGPWSPSTSNGSKSVHEYYSFALPPAPWQEHFKCCPKPWVMLYAHLVIRRKPLYYVG